MRSHLGVTELGKTKTSKTNKPTKQQQNQTKQKQQPVWKQVTKVGWFHSQCYDIMCQKNPEIFPSNPSKKM